MLSSSLEVKTKSLEDITTLIEKTKEYLAEEINSQMILLYWNIGKYINEATIDEYDAEHRKMLIRGLAKTLNSEFGKNFTFATLNKMSRFHETFPTNIVELVAKHLSWGHVIEFLPLKYNAEREFYIYMAISESWTPKELKKNIERMLHASTIGFQKLENYHKQALHLIRVKDSLSLDAAMQDQYILDFLQLPTDYAEPKFSKILLRELEHFLLEQNPGFSLIARQKRLTIKDSHYWLDLVFYHRKLQRVIAVDFKFSKFKTEYKQQMMMYLYWLKKYEYYDNENSPLGIIISIDDDDVHIDISDAAINNSTEPIASFLKLLPIDILEMKLKEIISKYKYAEEEHIELVSGSCH